MREKLYPVSKFPDGHPELAHSLNDMGLMLHAMGDYSKSLDYHKRSLLMRRKLLSSLEIPKWAPRFGREPGGNLSGVLVSMKEYAKALENYHQSTKSR